MWITTDVSEERVRVDPEEGGDTYHRNVVNHLQDC